MKPLKTLAAVTAAVLLTAFTIGANPGSAARPGSIPAERWIAIGPNAGFAVNANLGGPDSVAEHRSNVAVVAELYVKTTSGWKRARLDNPVSAVPLTP